MAILDYLPLIVFFVVYKLTDIYTATWALIAASALMLVVIKVIKKNISKQQWWLFAAVVLFGGLTLAFRSDLFIKWKVTVVYGAFALALLLAQLSGKSLLKSLLGSQMTLPEAVWRRMSFGWSGFFALMAGLNLVVAYHFSQDTWVNFKLFGTTALTLVACVVTGMVVYKHLPEEEKS
ncbi:septation protein A [Gallaecimonas xiamenensis]|uniref:Inner membrane-spanning protein YciB n=1 Tax=Gallaecimonas xiamenensis 3-C-1 TaxID=745411 RepID=K2JK62_9GAMM|nr:septation protein A [Gallaecimonas xiamenensis]EKE70954.1 intracellular septation protein A [Gallaecimonas xiamenensis 3-C-1]